MNIIALVLLFSSSLSCAMDPSLRRCGDLVSQDDKKKWLEITSEITVKENEIVAVYYHTDQWLYASVTFPPKPVILPKTGIILRALQILLRDRNSYNPHGLLSLHSEQLFYQNFVANFNTHVRKLSQIEK